GLSVHRCISSVPTRRSSDLGISAGTFTGTTRDGRTVEISIYSAGSEKRVNRSSSAARNSPERGAAETEKCNFLRRYCHLEGWDRSEETRLNSSHEWISYAVF